MDDLLRLAVSARQLGTDERVAALHLVIGGLADVVEQPAPPPQGPIQAEFLGQEAGEERDLQRVPQDVLRVAGAEMEPAQVVQQLLVQPDDVGLQGRLLAQPADVLLQLLLGLLDDLLDPGGMDAAVLDQSLQRDLGDLAPDAVETGDDDDAGRVVDDHVDSGGLLEGADVPAFPADDPAFHLVVGDVDGADGHLGGVRRRIALDRRGQDLPGLLLAALADGRLILQDQAADFAMKVVLDAFQEQVARLLGTRAGRCAARPRADRPGPAGPRRSGLAAPPAARRSDAAAASNSRSFLLMRSSFWSSRSARFSSRFSCSRRSRRMASASASISSRRRRASSLAARSAWRLMVSASRWASARIWAASPRETEPSIAR